MRKAFLLSLLPLLCSCGGDVFDPDLAGVPEVKVNIKRFDADLFSIDTAAIEESVSGLEARYGSFFVGFCETVVLGGKVRDSSFIPTLKLFVSHPDMRQIYNATGKVYPDLSGLEEPVSDVFRRWKYYFPETKSFPSVYSMVTGLNLPMSISDSAVGIGLDMYLGRDHEIYELAQFEKYRRRNMTQQNIIPDLIRAMGMSAVPAPDESSDLLSEMIYNGKIQFLIDLMAPRLPDTLKFGYSALQYSWCLENESNVWAFLVKDQLVFTTESQRIAQFINDGPFTAGLNKTSPARSGIWIGHRIVRSWIRKYGIEKLHEMLKTPARKLLDASGYKP
ncbi:MAG: hypothetical protein IT233_02120 [Bacteroidia bacterium]|nr:hypothetical protein [Bacteroidia bacterium]